MLKKILLASVASAVLALSAQGVATPVYAQVNIKPKVKVTPRARIRVVKPRVRIRVNTDQLANKKKKKGNSQPSVVGTVKAPVVSPAVTAINPDVKPGSGDAPSEFTEAANKLTDQAGGQGVGDAAEHAAGQLDLARFSVPGVNFYDPLNPDGDSDSNPLDKLDNPFRGLDPSKSGDLFGPSAMNDLTRQLGLNRNPDDPIRAFGRAVTGTPESMVANARGGIAGQRDGPVTLPGTNAYDREVKESRNDTVYEMGDRIGNRAPANRPAYTVIKIRPDRSVTIIEYGFGDNQDGSPNDTRDVTQTDPEGNRVGPTTTTRYTPPGGVNELRDPDSAGGGGIVAPNCGSHECNERRKQMADPFGYQFAKWSIGGVYTNPGGGGATAPTVGPEVLPTIRTDIVSQYDPDHVEGGGPAPLENPNDDTTDPEPPGAQ